MVVWYFAAAKLLFFYLNKEYTPSFFGEIIEIIEIAIVLEKTALYRFVSILLSATFIREGLFRLKTLKSSGLLYFTKHMKFFAILNFKQYQKTLKVSHRTSEKFFFEFHHLRKYTLSQILFCKRHFKRHFPYIIQPIIHFTRCWAVL